MIKFSIIIPVYNVEKYLKKCLDSVLSQTYTNYEVIIVCDKCEDESEKIVDKYVKNHSNFKKIYKEKTGLSMARNIGVENACGEYILFLDSDDYIASELLSVLNDNLNDNLDVLRFQARVIEKDNIIDYNEEGFDVTNGVEAFKHIIKYHFVENSWCYCYNKKFFKNHNFKFMVGCVAEDYGLTPLIIAKASRVKSISFIGYNYVQRENSLMSEKDYKKKVKKMDDMFLQATFLKGKLKDIDDNSVFISFINNSLIYYSTTLKKNDYKKYKVILKKLRCFDHLENKTFKQKIKKILITNFSWFFNHYIVR